jgi:hypothetical protein
MWLKRHHSAELAIFNGFELNFRNGATRVFARLLSNR